MWRHGGRWSGMSNQSYMTVPRLKGLVCSDRKEPQSRKNRRAAPRHGDSSAVLELQEHVDDLKTQQRASRRGSSVKIQSGNRFQRSTRGPFHERSGGSRGSGRRSQNNHQEDEAAHAGRDESQLIMNANLMKMKRKKHSRIFFN